MTAEMGANEDETWQRGITPHPLSGRNWRKGVLSVRRWVAAKRNSWDIPVEGFRHHVTTDRSLLESQAGGVRVGGQWCTLDHDEDMEPTPN